MSGFSIRTGEHCVEVTDQRGRAVRTWPYVRGDWPAKSWVAIVAEARELVFVLTHGSPVERVRALGNAGEESQPEEPRAGTGDTAGEPRYTVRGLKPNATHTGMDLAFEATMRRVGAAAGGGPDRETETNSAEQERGAPGPGGTAAGGTREGQP